MKKIMLATVAAFAFAGAASAGSLSYSAYGEYAVEAESIETGVGVAYLLDNNLEFSAEVVAIDTPEVSFEVDHVDLGVSYGVNPNADIYATVTLDDELRYDETVLGVALKF